MPGRERDYDITKKKSSGAITPGRKTKAELEQEIIFIRTRVDEKKAFIG